MEAFGGGVFTYLVNLSNALCNDFDIYIAYGIRKQTPENYKDYFDKRIHLVRVYNYQRDISLIKDTNALIEMRKIAKKVNPDIIHLNSSKAGILGRLLFKNWKIPVFYTPHGYSFLMANISSKKKIFYKSLEKFFAFKNIETIACSKGEYEITKQLTSNATYVNNGINLKEFNDVNINSHKTDINHLKIATIGRISLQKNPKLFNKIAEVFPNLKFTWIGDGDLRSELTSSNIKITGWVDNRKAIKYLNDSDIFVLTSLIPLRQAGQAEVPGGFQRQDEVGGDVEQPGQLNDIHGGGGGQPALPGVYGRPRDGEPPGQLRLGIAGPLPQDPNGIADHAITPFVHLTGLLVTINCHIMY